MDSNIKVGHSIEVIDRRYSQFPMRGDVLRIETTKHCIGLDVVNEHRALIRVNSPALPSPEIWVDLRLAKISS